MVVRSFAAGAVVSALVLGVGYSQPSFAAFQSCTGTGYDISGKVSPSSNCTILLPLGAQGGGTESVNPPPSTYTVNVEQFFGYNNWSLDGKYDNIGTSSGTDLSTLFSFSGGNQSGTFDLLSRGTSTEVLFVFKDGNDTNLVGYLLNSANLDFLAGAGSGTYASPFTDPPFDFSGASPKSISHITVYYREGDRPPQDIPEPSTLALAGLAALGLFAAGRRRKV